MRTLVVALDTAQYQLDVNTLAGQGGEDIYASFNLIMRRKAKENNFKAVLQVGSATPGRTARCCCVWLRCRLQAPSPPATRHASDPSTPPTP
jgi:intron-binding protein aquarius